jgi:hypothetical protein
MGRDGIETNRSPGYSLRDLPISRLACINRVQQAIGRSVTDL